MPDKGVAASVVLLKCIGSAGASSGQSATAMREKHQRGGRYAVCLPCRQPHRDQILWLWCHGCFCPVIVVIVIASFFFSFLLRSRRASLFFCGGGCDITYLNPHPRALRSLELSSLPLYERPGSMWSSRAYRVLYYRSMRKTRWAFPKKTYGTTSPEPD